MSGVPQGSVLGPLLFLIYINDIPEKVRNFLLLFADDLKLVVNAHMPDIAQKDLDVLNDWQDKWLLSFNTTDNKCKVLPVSRRGRCITNEYYLNGTILPIVETERDLGVNITNDLKWNYHISENITKAKKSIGWVTRNVISREPDVMINIYKTLVRHNLEFCVQLWSPVPSHGNWETIMEIESVQRKFTRLINRIGLMPYRDRRQELKITTLIEHHARGDLMKCTKYFMLFAHMVNHFSNIHVVE